MPRMRHRPASAIANTAAILDVLLSTWWQMPADLEATVLGAVMASRFSRACTLKQHLAVIQAMPTDLDGFFAHTMTPAFCMALLEDLWHEGLLTREQATDAEEYALRATAKDGTWRGDDGPQAA